MIKGISRFRDGEKFPSLIFVGEVNGEHPEKAAKRKEILMNLHQYILDHKIKIRNINKWICNENYRFNVSNKGKGQRGLIVAPPKVGKTTLLKKIAKIV